MERKAVGLKESLFAWAAALPIRFVAVSLLLSLLVSPSVADARRLIRPRQPSPNPVRSSERFLSGLEKAKLFSGDVAVAREGKVVFKKGYGRASFELDVRNEKDYAFNIASVTKSFIAVSLYQLEERGLLNTSDTVEKYFDNSELALSAPWCARVAGKGSDSPCHVPTIKQLLSMSSGVFDAFVCSFPETADAGAARILQEFCYPGSNNVTLAVMGALPKIATGTMSTAELVKLILMVPYLSFAPGEFYHYSNANFILAQYVIERVSRQPFAEYLRSRIVHPAGLSAQTGFDTSNGAKAIIPGNLPMSGYVSRHSQSGRFLRVTRYPSLLPNVLGLAMGAGAMQSTVKDLTKWFHAVFVTPHVLGLSHKSIKQLVFPHTPLPREPSNNDRHSILAYSQGMIVRHIRPSANGRPSLHGAISVTAIGHVEGFSARVTCVPVPSRMKKSTIIAVVSNMYVTSADGAILAPKDATINQLVEKLCSSGSSQSSSHHCHPLGVRKPSLPVATSAQLAIETLSDIWTKPQRQ